MRLDAIEMPRNSSIRCRMVRFMALLLFCAFLPVAASAAPPQVAALAAPGTTVAFRVYGLGLLPLDGKFTRFDGILTYDPTDHGRCQVELHVDVASLAMSNATIRTDVLGPDFMDAVHFPTLHFTGACQSSGLAGMLEMHGVSHPFAMDLDWEKNTVTAQGRLRRAEWGITARPFFGGSTVRITVKVTLPGPGATL
jgi:polyisoprenoid-binding protein YceI